VVIGIDDAPFHELIENEKARCGVQDDVELSAESLQKITERFKSLYRTYAHQDFPQDPYKQLELATRAVFNSWLGKRAVDYRNATGISHSLGTAVTIQAVVFGNMGIDSGTGVVFSRNPVNGKQVLYGDYLLNAQGEDVVAGIRNTKLIAELQNDMPAVYRELLDTCQRLERHFTDMQDVEF